MLKETIKNKPLIYSCSGCSSAAQMANYIALQFDRKEIAEMSCIAGVGGNVKKLVKTAQSGRKIIVVDGCPLACSKACLNNHNISPAIHFELSRFNVRKEQHKDFSVAQAELVMRQLENQIAANDHPCPNLDSSSVSIC
jgi:uncharacterized metal-binding protein